MAQSALDGARDLFELIDTDASAAAPDEPVSGRVMAALVDADLVGLMVPAAVGGSELPLLDLLAVYEEVSRADGSTGWCHFAADLTAAYFGAYLRDEYTSVIFAEGVPLMAGQFAPNGTARVEGDELVLNGDYQFGSGIAHAEWTGGGVMTEVGEGAESRYLFAAMPVSEVELQGNWDVLGLRATASYDYTMREVRIPEAATFDFFSPTVHRGGPYYAMGVLALTAIGHAGWALGVTRRVLDELRAIAASTARMGAATTLAESERFLVALGTLEGRLRAGRAWVREAVAEGDEQVSRDGTADPMLMNVIRQSCVHVNQEGADIAREAYLLAGTRALRSGPLQRCFRDLHAGSQHFFAGTMSTIEWSRAMLAVERPGA